jgi:hypothetical protein
MSFHKVVSCGEHDLHFCASSKILQSWFGENSPAHGGACAGLKLAHGETLSPEEEAILKEAEAEYESAQKTKGAEFLVFLNFHAFVSLR